MVVPSPNEIRFFFPMIFLRKGQVKVKIGYFFSPWVAFSSTAYLLLLYSFPKVIRIFLYLLLGLFADTAMQSLHNDHGTFLNYAKLSLFWYRWEWILFVVALDFASHCKVKMLFWLWDLYIQILFNLVPKLPVFFFFLVVFSKLLLLLCSLPCKRCNVSLTELFQTSLHHYPTYILLSWGLP